MKCPYCGSERIEIGVIWGKGLEHTAGYVGLKYKNGTGFLDLPDVAPVFSDLCLDCGSILQSAVRLTAPFDKGARTRSSPASLVKGRGTAQRWRDSPPQGTPFRFFGREPSAAGRGR